MKLDLLLIVMSLSLAAVLSVPADAQQKKKRLLPLHTRLTEDNARLIVNSARAHNLPPLLVLEVARQESGFNPYAQSSAGAAGFMQFIRSTALQYAVWDRFDTRQSIEGGCRYLQYLMLRYHGELDLVLAAYNSGEGNTDRAIRAGHRVPRIPETLGYVASILTAYRRATVLEQSFSRPSTSPRRINLSKEEVQRRLVRLTMLRDGQ